MAVNVFLKLGDIKGESKDDKFRDWIDVLSYSWGVTNSGDLLNPGRAEAQDFNFMQVVNRASPILFQKCVKGEHLDVGELHVVNEGGAQGRFLSFKFYDILLGAFQQSASDERPTESISFVYQKLDIQYRPQNEDGSLDAPITATWEFTKKE